MEKWKKRNRQKRSIAVTAITAADGKWRTTILKTTSQIAAIPSRRVVRFQVSCQPSEEKIIREKAEKAGLSLSRFLVDLALKA